MFFAIATGFFALATVFNMNALQGSSVGDVSLDAIAVMASANNEGPRNPPCQRHTYGWCYDGVGMYYPYKEI